MRKHHLISAAFVLMLSCLLAAAQTTGGVKGKVKNMNGDGIANASISAVRDGKEVKTVRTARSGEFVLDGLESGYYSFVVEAKGYAMGTKSGIEVKSGKVRDLGGNLILTVDRGSQVIIRGSVFYKDGTSVPGCEVEVATVRENGQARTLTTLMTDLSGQFSYRRPDAKATYRFTAKFRGVNASKDLSVESAAIYTVAVNLPVARGEKP
ncbi:MAG TPA: carboxypeptidase-like regulatory domain-containing protein [Pyrinomonadaceae bacterium]|nr:carboxypeptidase-like regulatory domain-containing protein [Pyrinomonadaceae bacterium]